jgi:hypothetical protein
MKYDSKTIDTLPLMSPKYNFLSSSSQCNTVAQSSIWATTICGLGVSNSRKPTLPLAFENATSFSCFDMATWLISPNLLGMICNNDNLSECPSDALDKVWKKAKLNVSPSNYFIVSFVGDGLGNLRKHRWNQT